MLNPKFISLSDNRLSTGSFSTMVLGERRGYFFSTKSKMPSSLRLYLLGHIVSKIVLSSFDIQLKKSKVREGNAFCNYLSL